MEDAFSQILDHPVTITIAKAFRSRGAEIALVGGVVRDALSGRKSDDLDFTTNLHPDEIRKVLAPLGKVWDAGARFGTLAVTLHGEKVEVTTYRTETYQEDSRKPTVAFGDSLDEDLTRRDLTINALALSLDVVDGLVTGALVDPSTGALDLRDGILRAPSEANRVISEDPLRAIRAVRFASLRTMVIHPSLQDAIKSNLDRMAIVARERKLAELEKMLPYPQALSRALTLSFELGIEREIFGELADKAAVEPLAVLEGGRSEALLLLCNFAEDGEGVIRRLKMPLADARWSRVALNALSVLSAPQTIRDLRQLVRFTPLEVILQAERVLKAQGVDTSHNRLLLDEIKAEPQVLAPLPVNGDDALALGIVGKDIRQALKRVEDELFQKGEITRQRALTLLQG